MVDELDDLKADLTKTLTAARDKHLSVDETVRKVMDRIPRVTSLLDENQRLHNEVIYYRRRLNLVP